MERELKDYLHYYLKGECQVLGLTKLAVRGEDYQPGIHWLDCNLLELALLGEIELKPILRKLDSILSDEHRELLKLVYPKSTGGRVTVGPEGSLQIEARGNGETVIVDNFTPVVFHYLLKQGFDLFGLIEENLAIDRATLNK